MPSEYKEQVFAQVLGLQRMVATLPPAAETDGMRMEIDALVRELAQCGFVFPRSA